MSLYPSMATYGESIKSWLSPRNAVTGVGVTVPCTVTRTAAVFMKPPVSQHAAVTADASNTRLTCALPTDRVTQGATSCEDRAYRVAGTGCRGDGGQERSYVKLFCLRVQRRGSLSGSDLEALSLDQCFPILVLSSPPPSTNKYIENANSEIPRQYIKSNAFLSAV